MSIEAMKLALAALETCRIRSVSEWSVEDITPKNVTAAIAALRTAIQQAEAQQPAKGEPVAWMASYVDPVGNDHVYVTSHRDLAVENDMHGEPKPLYTHPAPQTSDA